MRAGFPHRGTQPCNIYSMPGKVVTLTGNSPQNHGHQPISTIPGHYVPNLALAIVKGNAQTNDFRIPLAGFWWATLGQTQRSTTWAPSTSGEESERHSTVHVRAKVL